MAKAKPDVLAELSAHAPKRKTWFERLDDSAKAKLLEVRRLRATGECNHSIRTIAAYAKSLGAKVADDTFTEWLNAKD